MRKLSILLFIGLISFFQYCASSKKNASTATTSSTPAPKAPSVTYVSNIQSTIMASCSPCHIPPRGNKLALDTYDAAKSNIDDVIKRIKMNPGERGFMPFRHDKLSDSVIHIFEQWKAAGTPEK